MKILHIESDPDITSGIRQFLMLHQGFNIEHAPDGEEGVELAKIYQYDMVLLNAHLTDQPAIAVIRELRNNKIDVPIVVLGRAAYTEKPMHLDAGADDYIQAGYAGEELLAVLAAVVRRSRGLAQSRIDVGDLHIDMSNRTLMVGLKKLHLTGKEYQMLELLALRKGCVTKETIMSQLYGGMDEPEVKIIDVFVCKLRRKLTLALGCAPDAYIETIWGRGYALRAPETMAAE